MDDVEFLDLVFRNSAYSIIGGRAARPGEGFRACLGFAGSGVIDGDGELSWDLQELL
jgi:hypothetical protein